MVQLTFRAIAPRIPITMNLGMDFSDPRIAAFTFAIVMAIGDVGSGLGQPLSGALVDAVDFRWLFAVLVVPRLLTLPAIYSVFRLRGDVQTPSRSPGS